MSGSPRKHLVATALAAMAATVLAGCPIPQPLADVSHVDGGATVAPPRIRVSSVDPTDTIVLVDSACSSPLFQLSAQVVDDNTAEKVDARWFIDYAPAPPGSFFEPAALDPPATDDPDPTVRTLQPFPFAPDLSKPVHVVELVVSNGFYPSGQEPAGALPNRSAMPGYETQVFRWVFRVVDGAGRCQ